MGPGVTRCDQSGEGAKQSGEGARCDQSGEGPGVTSLVRGPGVTRCDQSGEGARCDQV